MFYPKRRVLSRTCLSFATKHTYANLLATQPGNSFRTVILNVAKDVEMLLVVPKDEEELGHSGVAVELKTFSEETINYIGNKIQAVR